MELSWCVYDSVCGVVYCACICVYMYVHVCGCVFTHVCTHMR